MFTDFSLQAGTQTPLYDYKQVVFSDRGTKKSYCPSQIKFVCWRGDLFHKHEKLDKTNKSCGRTDFHFLHKKLWAD
jgi:hypothetical protein